MLDAFIIDELRRRERQKEQGDDNRLRLPLPEDQSIRPVPKEAPAEPYGYEMPSRGPAETIVIDLAGRP